MTTFDATVYVGAPDSGDYFTDVLPPAVPDFVQRISVDEGQDETRPFQRARPPRASFTINMEGGLRPFDAGQLCVIQVETTEGTEEWFRGVLTTPKYQNVRHNRTIASVNALHTLDRLLQNVTAPTANNQTYATNLGTLFDLAGWPTDSARRIIDPNFNDLLSTWEVDAAPALRSAEAILSTAGPPARLVPLRNGGLWCIRDIGTIPGGESYSSDDIVDEYNLDYDDRSLVNRVVLGGTTYNAPASSSSDVREPSSGLVILPGLLNANRAELANRIFDAYQFGLTYLTLQSHCFR